MGLHSPFRRLLDAQRSLAINLCSTTGCVFVALIAKRVLKPGRLYGNGAGDNDFFTAGADDDGFPWDTV